MSDNTTKITLVLTQEEIVEYAKRYWDEHEWSEVKSLQVKLKPNVVLSLFDSEGQPLGSVQGALDTTVRCVVQVEGVTE